MIPSTKPDDSSLQRLGVRQGGSEQARDHID